MDKELLVELGFKDENGIYLPMLSDFEGKLYEHFGLRFCSNGSHFINYANSVHQYSSFIKNRLQSSMFYPCDEEGNKLTDKLTEQEEYFIRSEYDCAFHNYRWQEQVEKAVNKKKENYEIACNSVLFDFVMSGNDRFSSMYFENGYSQHYDTIEDVVNDEIKIYLK